MQCNITTYSLSLSLKDYAFCLRLVSNDSMSVILVMFNYSVRQQFNPYRALPPQKNDRGWVYFFRMGV